VICYLCCGEVFCSRLSCPRTVRIRYLLLLLARSCLVVCKIGHNKH
jgi:hypothetical protein